MELWWKQHLLVRAGIISIVGVLVDAVINWLLHVKFGSAVDWMIFVETLVIMNLVFLYPPYSHDK